jgi:hypothetical protein
MLSYAAKSKLHPSATRAPAASKSPNFSEKHNFFKKELDLPQI